MHVIGVTCRLPPCAEPHSPRTIDTNEAPRHYENVNMVTTEDFATRSGSAGGVNRHGRLAGRL
eukprot:scaffold14091_cov28-Tisochrysis_lutea.AAC.1